MDPTAEELIARLRRNPNDHGAFRALRAHYQRMGDSASLTNLLEGWAARATDSHAAAAAFIEASELALRYLADRNRAISLLERALERDPGHVDANHQLRALVEQSGDPRVLLEYLERRAAAVRRTGDARALADIEFQLGQLYEQTYARPDKAIAHYRRAFESDPTLVPAIYAAKEIYRGAGNHRAAATLFELEIKAEPTPERRLALYRELAHMRLEHLADLAGAINALERALDEAPGDLAVMHELASALVRRAEQRGAGPTSEQERQRAADLWYQMAQSVPADHALSYCETALEASPGHEAALELLERTAAETGRADLLPLRWVGYLQVHPNGPRANERRRRLGFAYLTAGQTQDALICLEPLLDVGDHEAAEALIPLYRERGQHDQLTRALSAAIAGLPLQHRAPRLREIIEDLKRAGDIDGAMQRARELLEIEPGDIEAMGLLESELRLREDFPALRELLIQASRIPGAGVEAKKARLREVAELSEGPLGDPEGAITAWRAIGTTDPTDVDAYNNLARLFEQHQRWDELVQVLDKQSLSITDPDARAALLFQIAGIHRDERHDYQSAIGALDALRAFRGDDDRARQELCDVLLLAEQFGRAVPLLEERIEDTEDHTERLRLLEVLCATLEEGVGDDEAAFTAAAQLLDSDPSNLAALDRMERIALRTENYPRLIETLSYRVEVVEEEERSGLLRRLGDVADQNLGDLTRAADYYQQALDVSPGDVQVLDALCSVFDRSERYKDLVVLLRERAVLEQDDFARAELYRRIARTLAERVRKPDASAEAWEKVLEAGEDPEALRALRRHAERHGDLERLEKLTERLIAVSEDAGERRDLMVARAGLLEQLDRIPTAIDLLQQVVNQVDPTDLTAMKHLADLCEAENDQRGLADALERQLALMEDAGLRQPLAQRLADIYEAELHDDERAVVALYAWCESDAMDPVPRRRLAERLEASERHRELVQALDILTELESDPVLASGAARQSARVTFEHLGDLDGAWSRLEPHVNVDEEADALLREIAEKAGAHERLAELFVQLAQGAETAETQRTRWADASSVYRHQLRDPQKALEAMLRAYALDLADEDMLTEVEELVALADAWPRLAQVYERLIRTVETQDAKTNLLMRHARLLDESANDTSEALDRVLRASALAPDDDVILATAEEMAPRAGRADELLIVYERRKSKADDDFGRMDAILRAARLTDISLRDRDRAFQYIAQAVSLTFRTPELADAVEDAVRALDEERNDLGQNDALRALVMVYRKIADDAEDSPVGGALLLLRSSRILAEDLNDAAQALNALKTASTYSAIPEVLDALEEFVDRTKRYDELDRHLEALIRDAFDSKTAAELLRRRGRLLEETLQRYDEAAEVYRQLQTVAKDDDATDRLLRCLRRAGQHQDLLIALGREVARAESDQRRVGLLREIALVWERDLANQYEARDAWNKVLREAPDDEEALEAVARLGQSTRSGSRAPIDDELLDEDSPEALLSEESQDEVELLDDLDGLELSEELSSEEVIEDHYDDGPYQEEPGRDGGQFEEEQYEAAQDSDNGQDYEILTSESAEPRLDKEALESSEPEAPWDRFTPPAADRLTKNISSDSARWPEPEESWDEKAPAEVRPPVPEDSAADLVLSAPTGPTGYEGGEDETEDGRSSGLIQSPPMPPIGDGGGFFQEEFTVAETEPSLDEMFQLEPTATGDERVPDFVEAKRKSGQANEPAPDIDVEHPAWSEVDPYDATMNAAELLHPSGGAAPTGADGHSNAHVALLDEDGEEQDLAWAPSSRSSRPPVGFDDGMADFRDPLPDDPTFIPAGRIAHEEEMIEDLDDVELLEASEELDLDELEASELDADDLEFVEDPGDASAPRGASAPPPPPPHATSPGSIPPPPPPSTRPPGED